MTILAITAYTGSKRLVSMTEQMLMGFAVCALEAEGFQFFDVAVNNAADEPIKARLVNSHLHNEKNEGFGNAINLAIKREIIDPPHLKIVSKDGTKPAGQKVEITDVLVLNNDLQFTDVSWLARLLEARDGAHVLSPCTDITATKEAIAYSARDLDPILHHQVSAFCWLVPVKVIFSLRRKFGFNLFHPDFTNYGSDDVTAACLRSIISKTPFKIVPRSFVKHLKAQTAMELGVKAGTKELLQRIANFKRARRLT